MKQLSLTNWAALGFACAGVLLSIIGMATGNNEGLLPEIGGLLTWIAVGVAIYGFITRSLNK